MTHQIGAHGYGWTTKWDSLEDAKTVLEGAKASRIDFVEIPIFDPFTFDAAGTRALFDEAGIGSTISFGLPQGKMIHEDRAGAIAFLRKQIEVATVLGSGAISGGLYTSLGAKSAEGPSEGQLSGIAAVLKDIAQEAAGHGIRLGVEAVNRYESYVLNTAAHLADMLDRIDEPNMFAHLDTYHMNIEETDFSSPIVALGDRLQYIHLSESHRGENGTGTVDWDEVFQGLREIDYSGPLVVEMFPRVGPDLILATGLWRDMSNGDYAGVIARSVDHARAFDAKYFG